MKKCSNNLWLWKMLSSSREDILFSSLVRLRNWFSNFHCIRITWKACEIQISWGSPLISPDLAGVEGVWESAFLISSQVMLLMWRPRCENHGVRQTPFTHFETEPPGSWASVFTELAMSGKHLLLEGSPLIVPGEVWGVHWGPFLNSNFCFLSTERWLGTSPSFSALQPLPHWSASTLGDKHSRVLGSPPMLSFSLGSGSLKSSLPYRLSNAFKDFVFLCLSSFSAYSQWESLSITRYAIAWNRSAQPGYMLRDLFPPRGLVNWNRHTCLNPLWVRYVCLFP